MNVFSYEKLIRAAISCDMQEVAAVLFQRYSNETGIKEVSI